jgi:hypothetical protein
MPCNKSKPVRSGERSQGDGTLLQLGRSTHMLVGVRMSAMVPVCRGPVQRTPVVSNGGMDLEAGRLEQEGPAVV